MSHSIQSDTRSRLVQQLLFLDEQMPPLLETYPPQQRISMHKGISRYVKILEGLLEKDDAGLEKALNKITLIGSCVTVYYEDEGFEEEFTVVLPTEIDPDHNKISFFSPIGSQLVTRFTGESFVLQTPGAHYPIRIMKTKLS